MIFALILFILMYVLMITIPKIRVPVVLATALIMLIAGFLPLNKVFGAVNWNVLLMLAGTMGTVYFFIESGMPARLADLLLTKVHSVVWAVIAMSLFSGFVSAFIDNVATVLMLAPIGLTVSKKLKMSPVPMLICISISSNLQGAATLVGDTTSILLGGYADMSFLDFFFMHGKFGIFWAVELGALVTVPVMLWLFRKEKRAFEVEGVTKVDDYFPTVMLILIVVLLIAASFIPNKPDITNGLICMAIFAASMIQSLIKNRGGKQCVGALKDLDFMTILQLTGLFIVIAAITEVGVIDKISELFVKIGSSSLFLMYTIIVFGSVIISAFVDNIPYVATMLPVVTGIAAAMGVAPYVLYFGLLSGATLGGNITPVGASANIATIGILKKEGYDVTTKEFLRYGIPFTLAAVLTGYVFIWLVWA